VFSYDESFASDELETEIEGMDALERSFENVYGDPPAGVEADVEAEVDVDAGGYDPVYWERVFHIQMAQCHRDYLPCLPYLARKRNLRLRREYKTAEEVPEEYRNCLLKVEVTDDLLNLLCVSGNNPTWENKICQHEFPPVVPLTRQQETFSFCTRRPQVTDTEKSLENWYSGNPTFPDPIIPLREVHIRGVAGAGVEIGGAGRFREEGGRGIDEVEASEHESLTDESIYSAYESRLWPISQDQSRLVRKKICSADDLQFWHQEFFEQTRPIERTLPYCTFRRERVFQWSDVVQFHVAWDESFRLLEDWKSQSTTASQKRTWIAYDIRLHSD